MTEQGSQLGGFLERSHVLEGNTEGKKSFLTFVIAGCYSHLAVSPAATGPAPLWPFYAAGLLPRAGGVRCKRSRRTAARRRLGAPRPSPFSGRGPTRAAAAGRGGAARARPGPAPRGGRGRDGGSGPGSPSAPLPPEMRGRCPCRGSRPS